MKAWGRAPFALRIFLRTPALTCLALLSLALGIGATTAIFSAIYSAIVDPFPYGDARHLLCVEIRDAAGQTRFGYTPGQFLDLTADTNVFSTLSGSRWREVALTGQGEPARLDGVYATANLFQALDVQPLLGRGFAERDARPDAPAIVVLSYKCWQRLFAGDPAVLGKQIRISDQVRTVVGVMPERVYWLDADVYMPTVFERERDVTAFLLVLGRLKQGMSVAEGEANLNSAFREMARREPTQFPDRWRASLESFPDAFPTKIRNELFMLLAAVGLLLAIACANVSSLLLSKASTRQKEMAIRASLGAGRGRIVRQLLRESLLLALAGCGLGLLLAWQGLRFLLSIVPEYTIPGEAKIALNLPVLLFSLGVAAAVAVLTGLAPALHASRDGLAAGLRENGRGTGRSRKQAAVREGLVVAEVALSLVLLVAAALMLRTLFALQHLPLGIQADRVLTMDIPLSNVRYKSAAERALALRHFLDAIRQTRGVVAAGLNTRLHPFDNIHAGVAVAGSAVRDAGDAVIQQTDEQYFHALGIPMLSGRRWTEAEVLGRRRFAIVNQTFARHYMSGRPVIGGSLRIPMLQPSLGEPPFEIIGVAADALNQGLATTAAPEVYVPYTLAAMSHRFAIRTVGEPMSVAPAIARAIREIDSQQLVTEVMSMDSALNLHLLALSRFQMILFSLFAAIGLALAIAGIYGVVSNAVERRTPELGVRLALGARPGQVVGLVLRSGLRLVLAGIVVGLVGALLATRFMANFLFGIRPADPLSFAAVALILTAVGGAACLWPAWRAARIDPACSLRQD